jgi:ABC-type transporter Mla maintaining outer membrane lipid asymmetry permease subunit MlaE
VLGGFALAAIFVHVSYVQQIGALLATLGPQTLLISAIRNLVLGAVLGLIVCHQGLVVPFSPARMPQIANQLLARSLVALVVVQGGAALFFS